MPQVQCPDCGERFFVVYPEQEQPEDQQDQQQGTLDARLESWRHLEPRHPYPAETNMDDDQIKREIQRVEATIDINGTPTGFEFFQKPGKPSNFWTHVVRAETGVGRKSKNAVVSETDELYLKNRGAPWDEDKKWTYLSKEQLELRSEVAGLGEIIELPDSEGGLGLLLDEKNRPLIVDGELEEALVLKLAKALLVMQSKENPAA